MPGTSDSISHGPHRVLVPLNERSGGFHYNALAKIHQTLIGAGFKHVQSNNGILNALNVI
jgi:hypothetical protein